MAAPKLRIQKIAQPDELEIQMEKLYTNRKLSEGYPGLEKTAFEEYMAVVDAQKKKRPDSGLSVGKLLDRVDRLVNLWDISHHRQE